MNRALWVYVNKTVTVKLAEHFTFDVSNKLRGNRWSFSNFLRWNSNLWGAFQMEKKPQLVCTVFISISFRFHTNYYQYMQKEETSWPLFHRTGSALISLWQNRQGLDEEAINSPPFVSAENSLCNIGAQLVWTCCIPFYTLSVHWKLPQFLSKDPIWTIT